MGSLPWYKEGLRFKCTGCGKCCTGGPGIVWITEAEMEKIAAYLKISLSAFKRTYIRHIDNRFALIERKTPDGEYDCIFLKDKKCMVYQDRPLQCRTFPWWQQNLNSEESWKLAAEECEGINEEAPLISCSEIQATLQKTNQSESSSN